MIANSSSIPLIGIDFGTTKTMAAQFDQSRNQLSRLKLGLRGDEIPTSIYQTPDGKILFGEDADDEGVSDHVNYIHRFKMKLGQPGMAHVGRRPGSAEEFTADFLSHIRYILKDEEIHCENESDLDRVVLTIPAIFGRAQQNELKRAAESAGFNKVVLIAEPVAAGIAYCEHHTIKSRLRFIVVDWGGGTFDVALVERSDDGQIKIIPEFVDGLEDIGGESMDDLLYMASSDALIDAGQPDLRQQGREMWGRYKRDIKRAKERLSTRDAIDISFILDDGNFAKINFERSHVEEVFKDIVVKGAQFTEAILQRCRNADYTPDFVLLAGGTSRIPMVKRVFEETLKLECRTWRQGRESIALGAALKASELWGKSAEISRLIGAEVPTQASKTETLNQDNTAPPPVPPVRVKEAAKTAKDLTHQNSNRIVAVSSEVKPDSDSKKWHYNDNKGVVGPVESAVILQKIRSGELRPNVMIWKSGMEKWLPASEKINVPEAETSIKQVEVAQASGLPVAPAKVLKLIRFHTSKAPDYGTYINSNIPGKKIRKAIASYAKVRPNEVLLFHDSTVFGGAKEGFVMTPTHLYWKDISESPVSIAFSEITSVMDIKSPLSGGLQINGIPLTPNGGFNSKRYCKMVGNLIRAISDLYRCG